MTTVTAARRPVPAPPERPPPAAPARGRRPMAVAVAVAVVALAGGGLFAVSRPDNPAAVESGTPVVAPAFSLDDVRQRGTAVSLGAGGRPVVLNFFAAWCVPCRAELPVLEEASRRAAGSVRFVGVDVADSRTAAAELLDATGVTFPAGYDPDRAVADRYRLRGMPTTVFIDARGRVSEVARGKLSAADLDRRLERLAGAGGVGTSWADAER